MLSRRKFLIGSAASIAYGKLSTPTRGQIFIAPNTIRKMVGTLNDWPNQQRPNDGINNSANFKRYCYAKYDIVNPSVVYTGCISGNTEANAPNPVTYHTALFDTSLNLIGEFTKGGLVNQVVNPGDIVNESDRLNVTISAGTGFYIVGHLSVTNGDLYYATDYAKQTALVTRCEEGVGLADKTLTPGAIGTTGINMWAPVGLMASVPLNRRLIWLLGDSISVSTAVTNPLDGALGSSAGGGIGYCAAYCDGLFDYVHGGRSGFSASQAKGVNYALRRQFINLIGVTDIWCELGINDLSGSSNAVTTASDIALAYSAIQAAAPLVKRLYQSTITPRTTITGSPPTSDTNQTIYAGISDGRRNTLNTTILANGITGQYGFCQAAISVQNMLNSDWWVAGGANDGLHPQQAAGMAQKAALITANALAL